MTQLTAGIIGAGTISHCHMEAYRKILGVRIAAVCDINAERAEQFCRRYGVERYYPDHRKMLESEKLDAVSVVTWNDAHAPIAVDAMKAGAHVLCEKPLALNAREAMEMARVSQSTGKLLLPGFCTRYEEGARLLKAIADGGDLGRLYHVKATFLRRCGNPGGWFADGKRSGGGPVIDLGVHVLDLARYFTGSPNALTVSASVNRLDRGHDSVRTAGRYMSADYAEGGDVEDSAMAFIRFDNGVTLDFETSWSHHVKEDSLQMELFGAAAGATLYPHVQVFSDKRGYLCDTVSRHTNNEDKPNYDFDEEIAHFVSCVRGEAAPICAAEDGVEVMRIVDAIYRSAAERREVEVAR
jgi:predicted dehydrogenase